MFSLLAIRHCEVIGASPAIVVEGKLLVGICTNFDDFVGGGSRDASGGGCRYVDRDVVVECRLDVDGGIIIGGRRGGVDEDAIVRGERSSLNLAVDEMTSSNSVSAEAYNKSSL